MSASDVTAEPAPSDDAGSLWAERVLAAASTAFTVFLFFCLIWQGATAPATAAPMATVVGTDPLPGGQIEVAVELHNT